MQQDAMERGRRLIGAWAIVIALATAAAAHAAPIWWHASSDHFEVYTTGNERHAREAIAAFERVHAFFESAFDLQPGRAPRTRLIVFSSPKEFAPYKPNAVAGAFYQSSPDGDYIAMQSLDADAFPVVVHEYAHLMLRRTGVDYPLWLNEGFAEFYSTMTPQGRQMRLGLVPPQRMLTLATAAHLIPLDRLLAIDERSPEYNEKDRAALFYAESWALTHMLLAHEAYRDRTRNLLDAIARGTPAAEALSAAYGKSLAAVGADLEHYVRRSSYAYTLAASPEAEKDLGVTAEPADAVDAAVTLAALIGWQRDRAAEGRAALAALEGRAPDNLHLAEARGLLEMETEHRDAARPYLAKAVALGSANAAVLRACANLVAPSDPQQEEALLTKAAAVAPYDVDVRIDLARALVDRRRGAEAMTMLAAVTRVPKDRAFSFFEVLTMAAVGAEQIDDAKAAAAKAAGAARTEAERLQAGTLAREAATARPTREVTGRLTNVICGSGPTILEVTTDAGVLRLVMDNPQGIRGPGGATTSLTMDCGEQSRPIRVGYVVVLDNARKTIGAVRMMDIGSSLSVVDARDRRVLRFRNPHHPALGRQHDRELLTVGAERVLLVDRQ